MQRKEWRERQREGAPSRNAPREGAGTPPPQAGPLELLTASGMLQRDQGPSPSVSMREGSAQAWGCSRDTHRLAGTDKEIGDEDSGTPGRDHNTHQLPHPQPQRTGLDQGSTSSLEVPRAGHRQSWGTGVQSRKASMKKLSWAPLHEQPCDQFRAGVGPCTPGQGPLFMTHSHKEDGGLNPRRRSPEQPAARGRGQREQTGLGAPVKRPPTGKQRIHPHGYTVASA